MSTIAQLGVSTSEFALRETLTAVPDVTVEAERVVAHDDDSVMPFCWASGSNDELDAFEEALAEDPTVTHVERISKLEDGRFYQMKWVDSIDVLVHSMTEHGAAILKATGENDRWHFRILFPNRDAFAETHEFCQERGLDIDIEQVHELDHTKGYGQYGLTEEQYEALTTALDNGYYAVPRQSSARDLADDLSISHQAVSERLRRGHESLVESALTVSFEDQKVKR